MVGRDLYDSAVEPPSLPDQGPQGTRLRSSVVDESIDDLYICSGTVSALINEPDTGTNQIPPAFGRYTCNPPVSDTACSNRTATRITVAHDMITVVVDRFGGPINSMIGIRAHLRNGYFNRIVGSTDRICSTPVSTTR